MSKEVSQVFGGIGDAVSGVLKGVGDAVDGAVKGVGTLAKQIYDSDVGKAIIIAGAIYFGGAALSGGFGSYGAGGSFFSGMGTGVASAADSIALAWEASSLGPLGNAWGAAGDAGANAARTLAGSGLSVAPSAASAAAAPPVAPAPAAAVAPPPVAAVAPPPVATAGLPAGSPINSAAANLYTPVAEAAVQNAAADPSWYSKALDYITPKSELAKYGLISGASQLAGGLIQGAGQQQAVEDEREAQEAALKAAQDLRNANMSAELFAPSQYAAAPAQAQAPTGFYKRYMPRSDVAGSRFSQAYANLPPGQGLVRSVMG
jgi:hypothetical protein